MSKKLKKALFDIVTDDAPEEPVGWGIIWECITRPGKYGLGQDFPGLAEDAVKEALAELVAEGKLIEGPARDGEQGWREPTPDVPAFILRVEDRIGIQPVKWPVPIHISMCGDYVDFTVPIEPQVSVRDHDDPEAWAQRERDEGHHVIKFRNIVEWGPHVWLAFLERYHRTYEQSTWDEDDEKRQPGSPEAAMADLIDSLSDEIGRLERTRSALVKAFNDAGGLGKI